MADRLSAVLRLANVVVFDWVECTHGSDRWQNSILFREKVRICSLSNFSVDKRQSRGMKGYGLWVTGSAYWDDGDMAV